MGTPVVLADRVLVATTTTGTGTYAIGTAITGYLDPAGAGVTTGARLAYVVVDSLTAPTGFEIGEGIRGGSVSRYSVSVPITGSPAGCYARVAAAVASRREGVARPE